MQKTMQSKPSSSAGQKPLAKKSDKDKKAPAAGRKQMVAKRSLSSRAGLILPVPRFAKLLRAGKFSRRVSPGASVFLTSVLEYLLAELLDISAKAAERQQRQRIAPKHVLLGIQGDQEFLQLLGNVTIRAGGVQPNIHPALYAEKSKKLKGDAMEGSEDEDEEEEEDEEAGGEDAGAGTSRVANKTAKGAKAGLKAKQKTKAMSKSAAKPMGRNGVADPHVSTAAPSEDEFEMEDAEDETHDNVDDHGDNASVGRASSAGGVVASEDDEDDVDMDYDGRRDSEMKEDDGDDREAPQVSQESTRQGGAAAPTGKPPSGKPSKMPGGSSRGARSQKG